MIFEKVQEIIVNQLGVDEEEVTLESTFDDLGADSFDVVELVVAVEEEFDIEIPDDKVADFETVGEVVEYIKAQK